MCSVLILSDFIQLGLQIYVTDKTSEIKALSIRKSNFGRNHDGGLLRSLQQYFLIAHSSKNLMDKAVTL